MNKKRFIEITFFCLLFIFLFCQVSNADVIHLKNGNKIEGTITKETEDYIEIDIGDGTIGFGKQDVASIERNGGRVERKHIKEKQKKLSFFESLKRIQQMRQIRRELNPSSKEAEQHYQKAKGFIDKRDADNAIFHLKKAIDLGHKDGYTYCMLGMMYKIKGSKSEAKKYLKMGLKGFEKQIKFFRKINNHKIVSELNKSIRKTKEQLAILDD